MRLLVTADLHYDHTRSKALADEVIDRMNEAGGDVLLVAGDTAAADGDALERCLGRFRFAGPKLFLAGNHELWTYGPDSYALFAHDLPRRVRDAGWHWLEGDAFVADGVAVAGSVGWYDYSFASLELGIPQRFYERKVSPAAAERLGRYPELLERTDDIGPGASEVMARWNDGKFVKLGRGDEQFLDERLAELEGQLSTLESRPDIRTVVASVHHVPFPELLPPRRHDRRDFANAFLGGARMGAALLRHQKVRHVLCGHSHFPAEATFGEVRAVNIGSGYRWKTFVSLDV